MLPLCCRQSLFFCFVLFSTQTVAFFPHNNFLGIHHGDYTIETITREALLQVTGKFFQGQKPASSTFSFESISPLTESTLFRAYYGGQVSAEKFAGQILSVASSAMKFCRSENTEALFLNEKIADGLALLLSLRRDLNDYLSLPSNETDYDLVQEMIGAVICMQSSFYSNTNWVEMYGSDLYTDLGISTDRVISIAHPLLPTCTDCPVLNGNFDCATNILPSVTLTSGYIQDKPYLGSSDVGKCSHGGQLDPTETLPARGGINKETSDPKFSPHYFLHQVAGKSAIAAAIELFLNEDNGILWNMGPEKFKKMLELGTGLTLCVVMDTSGSMADDKAAVVQQTENIVTARLNTVHFPERFIFVPFSDPETGPVMISSSSSEFLKTVRSINPGGGGDCPELSMQGLLLGLQASPDSSNVFLFTDATPKDGHFADQVIARALEKQISPQFLLTGDCSASENTTHKLAEIEAPMAGSEYPDLYQTIAYKTGGNVFYSSKSDIEEVTGVIDILSGADHALVLKLITNGTRDYFLPVDQTLRDLSVFIASTSGTNLPGQSLMSPTNKVTSTAIQTANLVAYGINKATSGTWKLHLDSPVKGLTVEVFGSSSLNVHVQMYEKTGDGRSFPTDGNLIAGKQVVFVVSVLSSEDVGEFHSMALTGLNGVPLVEVPLTYSGNNTVVATTTIPSQGFRVLVKGSDASGNTIFRLIEDFYEPQHFRLELNQPSPIRINPIVPVELPYTLNNFGSEDENFIVTVSDASHLINTTVHVTASGNFTGVLRLNLQNYSTPSVLPLTITGTSSSGRFGTNYNNFRLFLTSSLAINGSDIKALYVETASLASTTEEPSGEAKEDISSIVGAVVGVVAGVAVAGGIITVVIVKVHAKHCVRVSP